MCVGIQSILSFFGIRDNMNNSGYWQKSFLIHLAISTVLNGGLTIKKHGVSMCNNLFLYGVEVI